MTPPDVIQTGTPRTIAPRTQSYPAKMDGPRTPRDERRRAQHNEVERRRRDKINNWIVTLSKIIPDCNMDSTKTGASKGGILSKACDYIRELRQSNQRLQESLKEVERIQVDNELCRQQIEELKNENALLRAQLQQHGIEMVGETPPQWKRHKEQGGATPLRHITDTVEKKARWRTCEESLSFYWIPWIPRSWTLRWPIVAVLDCSNPIEITTRYNLVEMCSKKICHEREPLLNSSLVLYLCSLTHGLWCLSFNFVPCQCMFSPWLLILI